MARTEPRAAKGGGEAFQILIMTLFMTGGGFALVSAVFYFFIIPARADDLELQIKDHNELAELLDPRKNDKTLMYNLRKRARDAEKLQGTANLHKRIEDELSGLRWSTFPATVLKPKGNTTEQFQTINIKDASLQDIFSFIGRVKQENPSVQVSKVSLTRGSRSQSAAAAAPGAGSGEDRWNADLYFHLYTTTGAGGKGAPPAGQPKAEEAGAGAESTDNLAGEPAEAERPQVEPERPADQGK